MAASCWGTCTTTAPCWYASASTPYFYFPPSADSSPRLFSTPGFSPPFQNAINISRTLHEKVLTPPLVMFLAACILHTVEQLHAVGIVHADIKPDNFMLGER